MKICIKCNKNKDDFHSKNVCKDCHVLYMEKYRKDNKEKIKLQRKEYKKKNKISIKEYKVSYNKKNKEKVDFYNKNYLKQWREGNKDYI